MNQTIRNLLLLCPRGGFTYLLRDLFPTAEAGPLSSPRTCAPGPGTLTLTQTDGQFSVTGGRLAFTAQATPTFGDLVALDTIGRARVVGRAVFWRDSATAVNGNPFLIGWSNSPTPNANAFYGLFRTTSGGLGATYVRILGSSVVGAAPNYLANTEQHCGIVMRATGCFALVETATPNVWNLHWIDNTISAVTSYAGISIYDSGGTLDDMIVRDLGGNWASDFGIATARIETPNSGNTLTGNADGTYEITWTPQAAETFVYRFRYTDDDNCWRIECDQAGGTIKLYERDTAADTERDAGKTQTWTVGLAYRIVIKCVTQSIKTWVATTIKHNYATAAFNQTVAGLKVSGFVSAQNFVAWPYAVALNAG